MYSPRIAVIGGVAAGPAAAAQAKRICPSADVHMYERGAQISYGACEMPYYLSGQIEDLDELIINTPDQFEKSRGVKVHVNHLVQQIRPADSRIVVQDLADGRVWEERFDKIILATGASARRLGADGEDSQNVFQFRELYDAERLRLVIDPRAIDNRAAENSVIEHAVVIGGGYVGVEVAEALTKAGVRTTILDRDGRALRKYVEGPLNDLVDQELRSKGITVRKDSVKKITADQEGRVESVWTNSGERIGCQLVVVAIGVEPNVELAVEAGIRLGNTGAIKVDSGMRTSAPSVWACGDCIEVERIVDGSSVHSTLATTAYRTARVAAGNASRLGKGKQEVFPGITPSSAIKVFDLEIARVGLSHGEAEAAGFDVVSSSIQSWSRVKMYPGAKPIHVDFVVQRRTGRLLGAEIVGEEGVVQRANVLVAPLREGWTVAKIKDLDLIYAPPFGPSLDPLIVAARSAEKKSKGL